MENKTKTKSTKRQLRQAASIAATAILVLSIYSLVQMQSMAVPAYAAGFLSLNVSASNTFTAKDAKYTVTAKIATRNFVKTMTVTFPTGFDVSGASFDGMEGMREDGKLTISGQTLTYTNPRPVRLNPERIVTISVDQITNHLTEGIYSISVATKGIDGNTVDSGIATVAISSDIITDDADDITIENVAGDITLLSSDDINIIADNDVNISADGSTIRLDAATDSNPEIIITDVGALGDVELDATVEIAGLTTLADDLVLTLGSVDIQSGSVDVAGTIHAGGTIESDNDLVADDSIEAGVDITAGNDIEAGDDIIAGGNFNSLTGSVNLGVGGVNAPLGTITGLTVNGGTVNGGAVNAGVLTVGAGGAAAGIALAKAGASLLIDAALDVDGSIEGADGLTITGGAITLPNGQIDGNEIADNTVTTDDIADDTIIEDDINPAFIRFSQLSDNAVGNLAGWTPATSSDMTIIDTNIDAGSVVLIMVDDATATTCAVYNISEDQMKMKCTSNPGAGAKLSYIIINQ